MYIINEEFELIIELIKLVEEYYRKAEIFGYEHHHCRNLWYGKWNRCGRWQDMNKYLGNFYDFSLVKQGDPHGRKLSKEVINCIIYPESKELPYRILNQIFNSNKKSKVIETEKKTNLSRIPNPTAISTNSETGIYMLLQANLNYDTDEMIYCCKIGMGGNICKRIKQYHTYNVGFFHNDMSISCESESEARRIERKAQNNLRAKSQGVCGESLEWFMIDKELFYELKKNGLEILKSWIN